MKLARIIYLLLGIALLGVVIASTDLDEVRTALAGFGWQGVVLVAAIFGVAFAVDSVSWTLCLAQVPVDRRWCLRMWLVRSAGEAFNAVLPAAGFGGEPYKAMALNARYRVGYGDGAASLVLARTVNLIGLVVFLLIGLALVVVAVDLPDEAALVAGAGLVTLTLATGGFFIVQRYRVASRLLAHAIDRPRLARLGRLLAPVEAFDQRLAGFYRHHRGRFTGAVALSLVNWLLGALEVWVTLALLGVEASFSDALVIEAVTQMVRAGAFFIPLNLGAQEGVLVMMTGAVLGAPSAGLGAAIVRRVREVIWIAFGLGVAASMGLSPADAEVAGTSPDTPA